MQATQREILQLISLSERGVYDEEIAKQLDKDIHEIRFHLEDLDKGGFIKLITSKSYDGESYLAAFVTSRGHMVLREQISLEDRVDSNSQSHVYTVTNNAPVGAQQFGSENTAGVTQNIGANATEVLEILKHLEQTVETLPQDRQDIATNSLATVEEEISAPAGTSRLRTALFTLWSIGKDIASFTNAVTALAERLNIQLPGVN